MSGLKNLEKRLQYYGGAKQVSRMNKAKLVSLKNALYNSYQSATAVLKDGREFKCLINPDKLKEEVDSKIISIPFEDECLNHNGRVEKVDLKGGEVFTWKENQTDWLVLLQNLEETAYFRADIRRCKYEIEINGIKYKIYANRKGLNDISWRTKVVSWNELNYDLDVYITKDENTLNFFKRFQKVEVDGKPWEVEAIDTMNLDGVMIVALKEYYKNTIEEEINEEKETLTPEIDKTQPYIEGEKEIYPYDTKTYKMVGMKGGDWSVDNKKVEIISKTDTEIKLYINTGRSGKFNLKYTQSGEEIILPVEIKSL